MLILIYCLTIVGLILGILGFFYQKGAINKLAKKEQPIDTKDIKNRLLLRQNLIGAGSMLLGSLLLLIALILSIFPR